MDLALFIGSAVVMVAATFFILRLLWKKGKIHIHGPKD